MTGRSKIASLALLTGIPALLAVLWLASGRETFTKSARTVQVAVRNEVFGDTDTRTELVRGPICGYYVGLDVVLLAIAVAAVLGLMLWLVGRRRRRLQARPPRPSHPAEA
jgi:hypothetical protein